MVKEDNVELKQDGKNSESDLRSERTNLRRTFTRAANTFNEVHRGTNKEKDIHVVYLQVAEKAERLFRVDEAIKNLNSLSEDDFDLTEDYRDRFAEVRVLYERNYNQGGVKGSIAESEGDAVGNLGLPRLQLKEYDLMPRSWVSFWGQFGRIHEDENLREEDKFQYLLASLRPRTKGRDIAESYPPTKDNYKKVIEHLKERFGRKDLLIEVYFRDLLALVGRRSGVKLTDLYDKLGSYLRALETLGVTTAEYAAMLFPVVESCLPSEILKAWDRYRKIKEGTGEVATKEQDLENLMTFLRHEVEGEEHRVLAEQAFGAVRVKRDQNHVPEDPSTAAVLFNNQPSKRVSCIFCDGSHWNEVCWKVGSMSLDDRRAKVMEKRCCLVCLKPGHMAKECRSYVKCFICNRRHFAFLCQDLCKNFRRTADSEDDVVAEERPTDTLVSNPKSVQEVYLKTITVRLRHREKELCVRALLDDGSQRSYIEKKLAGEMNLSPSGKEVICQGLFGGGVLPATEHGRYVVTVESLDRGFSTSLSLLDQPRICSALPRVRDQSLLRELASRGIELTDVGENTPPIRILLGADVLGSILTGRIEVLNSGISALETRLGWAVLGVGRKKVLNMVSLTLQNAEVNKLWDLDVLGITDPVEKKSDTVLEQETLTHFRETLRTCADGRYEVSLPWLAGHPVLYDRSDVAETRLRSVTRRLLSEQNYKAYDDIFKQWEAEGIIEVVPEEEISKPGYYIPHRPVIKLSSSTTKVRPVFDASYKRTGYASLNECLSIGPSLIPQILPILLRFRTGAFGVIADIKQAFLQISLKKEDRDVLRFLWWEDEKRTKPKVFRHCRVVFGIASSPFLLNATIEHHLGLFKFELECFRDALGKLKEGFYVDNLVTSVDQVDEAYNLKSRALQIMKEGGFELRCWASNAFEDKDSQMVLGVNWNLETDELLCKLPEKMDFDREKPVTKRVLLSVVNSFYDPLGFMAPALLLPKILLQEAWRRRLGWDEELPTELEEKYQKWVKTAGLMAECSIPRRLLFENHEVTLHVFTDASASAYAACAYLRSEYEGRTKVNFVAARTRVAPLQKPTIPRLELLGATVGARLAATLKEILLPVKTFYWTDSMIVLSWITRREPWNTFVGNRVKEIRELTDIEDWRHVPGEDNPADLVTRSCDWLDLRRSRWWEGPGWLYEMEDKWPRSEVSIPEEALLERRRTVATNLVTQNRERFSERFLYFSSYTKILRMTAYVLRFCGRLRKKHTLFREVSCEELEKAELALIRIVQSEWSTEIRNKYAQTIQFCEENGVLKVKTRLVLSRDPDDFTRPTVFPNHALLERLVNHTHRSLSHAGVMTTLAHLRERFWIPKGRQVVKTILRQCLPCRKLASKNVRTDLAPLPTDRIDRVAAFQVTGADLAGPLFLRGGNKAWIVLFTCAVYRAVHLELVSSLSSEAFMQALRRFWGRRGRCSTLYTDNGTNFRGTSNALNSLDWDFIQRECSVEKVKWIFSPPSAPWFGGFWERMVRCVKELLRKTLGRSCVTYEEMLTLLIDCESTINARPLTYLSDDPNELNPLTPAHFIQDLSSRESCDLDLIESKHLLKRVRYLQTLRENLRKRFYKEYLGELIRNPRAPSRRSKISPGEIVLVEYSTPNRMNWPLAQVIEVYPGKDGVERVVKLRVATGEIIRPVQRIYPLELESTQIPRSPPDLEFGLKDEKSTGTDRRDSSDHAVETDPATEFKTTRYGRKVKPVQIFKF